jgi:hypothetical protein
MIREMVKNRKGDMKKKDKRERKIRMGKNGTN